MFTMPMPSLPVLRDDLELLPGPRALGGAPTWTVYDPVRNRYFRITQAAFELLSRWHFGDWESIAAAVALQTGRRPQDDERDWLVQFLNVNMLIRRPNMADVADMMKVKLASKTSWLSKSVHTYLFFRIPLVRPQRFLKATLPWALRLVSRPALLTLLAIALIGGYLTVEQWSTYLSTFLHFSSVEGALWYGLALLAAKVLHELGHAYTAVRFGCRVPTMGVAFMVMWPVLYTDTSDAWRLTDKKQRLAIGAAGMLAELALAVVATFVWNFLPDGPARSAAFIVATVTWIMTLTMNLNPFMRFDGYYLLSDVLEVENLQDRSFAHARWWFRERLFGFGESVPEVFPSALGRGLLIYACATWIYRLVLFLGIAALVYAFFFKVLGIILFTVEIVWFIGLPIAREGMEWWKRRADFHPNRNLLITGGLGVLVVGLMVVPWRTSISVPAVVQAVERAQVYAPVVSKIEAVQVKRGDPVAKGDSLMTLASPDLVHQIAQAQRRIDVTRVQVRREAAGGQEAENIRVLRSRMAGEITALRSLEERKALLTVQAPMSGTVTDLDSALKPGVWVNDSLPLARVVGLDQARIYGFVDERDLARIEVGASARFYPDDPGHASIATRVLAVADVNSRVLDIPYLASMYGGGVAVEQDLRNQLIPVRGIYRVTLEPLSAQAAPPMVLRGVAHVQGAPESLLGRIWNQTWGLVLRESGF